MMGILRGILAEVIGLFVDDGSLALALIVWCGGFGLGLSSFPALLPLAGPALFLGCAMILVANVVRSVRPR
jgi:hypothetical protein